MPALTVLAAVVVVAALFGSGIAGRAPDPAALAVAAGASSSPAPASVTPAGPVVSPDSTAAPSPASGSPSDAPAAADPNAAPPAPDGPVTAIAIVPVTNFRSPRTSVAGPDIAAIAAGTSAWSALVLVSADADPILATLGTTRAALGSRLVLVSSTAALAGNLAANRTRLAFVRADDLRPSVRALAWGGVSITGVNRVASLAAWPLVAQLPGPTVGAPAYDPAAAWTLVAGGDILLDRGVSLAMTANGRDYPYRGGTVKITGHCLNCSPMGWDLPYTRRTGNAGAFTALVKAADIAIANFENPAPNSWHLHTKGMIFSANPKNIAGVRDAGFDWVSMANNHIGDAGKTGIVQTQANLDAYGIKHTGAGRNCADAHKASLLKAGGVTVGILAYDSIAGYYRCGTASAGSARLTVTALKADIAATRARGADVVIVFPHWGIEYHAAPSAFQLSMGRAAIDAGADMVIGNHPHWAEGMEVYKGKPIWYALGNLVFDQSWSEPTMEGITLEMTFQGKVLEQVRIRPHLIMVKSQPNFMDPAGSGKVVMDQVWKASAGRLPW
ncbi:MAG: CapA family protein [Chloroflexota bacterium]